MFFGDGPKGNKFANAVSRPPTAISRTYELASTHRSRPKIRRTASKHAHHSRHSRKVALTDGKADAKLFVAGWRESASARFFLLQCVGRTINVQCKGDCGAFGP